MLYNNFLNTKNNDTIDGRETIHSNCWIAIYTNKQWRTRNQSNQKQFWIWLKPEKTDSVFKYF